MKEGTQYPKSLGLAIAIWLTAAAAAAQQTARAAPIVYRMDNGLQVVLKPQPAATGVTLLVAYHTGSAHDPPGYQGLAHLVEHLSFRGSRHLEPLEGGALLRGVGGSFQGSTQRERTVYLTSVPAQELPLALWIESERMAFALDGIDQRALELEQQIVIHELEERRRSASSLFWAHQADALYGTERLRWERFDVAAIDLEAVRWFYQAVYRPDNATLVLVGRFSAPQARALVARYFADLPNPPLARFSPPGAPPRLCGTHRIEVAHPFIDEFRVASHWVIPKPLSVADAVQLRAVLEELEGRLHRRLVDEAVLAEWVDASLTRHPSHAVVSLDLQLVDHRQPPWREVESAMDQELAQLADRSLSEGALERLRASLLTEAILTSEESAAHAMGLVTYKAGAAEATRAAIATLSVDQVRATARSLHLPPHRRLLARWEPLTGTLSDGRVLREENPCR